MNMLRNIKFRLSALAVLLLATSCLDKYPESAFASVGTIDEVREKARAQGAV